MGQDIEELYGDNQDTALTTGDLQLFKDVDSIIQQAVDSHDVGVATKMGRALRRDVRVRGVGLAKLLWSIRDNWSQFEIEDDFYNVIEDEVGLSVSTVHKYVNLWDALFANPEITDEIKQRLLCKPTRTLLLLTGVANDDNPVDWEAVVQASDHDEVRQIVKGARGEHTSSETAVFIRLDMRTGQLYAQRGSQPAVIFGLLNMELNDDASKKAIERIITNCRILEV